MRLIAKRSGTAVAVARYNIEARVDSVDKTDRRRESQ
jgi:hypothetical protein